MPIEVHLAGTIEVESESPELAKEMIQDWLEYHTIKNNVVVHPVTDEEPLVVMKGFVAYEPCPVCGSKVYDDHTLALYAMGQVNLDMQPTHLCRPKGS